MRISCRNSSDTYIAFAEYFAILFFVIQKVHVVFVRVEDRSCSACCHVGQLDRCGQSGEKLRVVEILGPADVWNTGWMCSVVVYDPGIRWCIEYFFFATTNDDPVGCSFDMIYCLTFLYRLDLSQL